MNAAQYRAQLEARKAQIQRMQETPEGRNSLMLRTHLGTIVENMIALDNGKHWTQEPGDTLHKIVIGDLQASSSKKFNR